jgi:uncharacterized protein
LTAPKTLDLSSPLAEVLVPPYEGRAVEVERGNLVRLANVEGEQIGDTWAVNADDSTEVLSTIFTRTHYFRIYPRPGDQFLSSKGRPMLTFLEDTSPGKHDMLCHACHPHFFELFGGDGDHPNCYENFKLAMAAIGRPTETVPDPLNFFEATPVNPDGTFRFEVSPAGPGDYVLLRAEMDLVFVVASCSFDLPGLNDTPPNGNEITSLLIDVHRG